MTVLKKKKLITMVTGAAILANCLTQTSADPLQKSSPAILNTASFKHYIDRFNEDDEQLYANIPNEKAWEFLKSNVPLLECPDTDIERTYYFRWWTYRKHIKQTPDGWVITEFLPTVPWSGKHNTISCPAGHHFYEGRWLHNSKYLNDYAKFWFRGGGHPRLYSFWAADALYACYLVENDSALAVDLLDDLIASYEAWEKTRMLLDGLFWQYADRDGMEAAVGGDGKRPTINSYMYGDAMAIARIAELAGKVEIAEVYRGKADKLRKLIQTRLWDADAEFFKTLKRSDFEKKFPKHSNDPSVGRFHWYDADHRGTCEWMQYDFPDEVAVDAVEAYWMDDNNRIRLPESWSISYSENNSWKPVRTISPYTTEKDRFNHVKFAPVKTQKLRLVVQPQAARASGIYEWRVMAGATNVAPKARVTSSINRKPGRFGNSLKTLNDGENASKIARMVDVRELHGYTPWYFHVPEPNKGYEVAWRQLMDPDGFYASFGPTTAEQRHQGFKISYEGHACQWNGPSWPLATSVTLTAMANVLNDYRQDAIDKNDYFEILKIYTRSHRRRLQDGRVVCWIDENIDPFTGAWLSRTMLHKQDEQKKAQGKPPGVRERGKDYNHSSYCDLIITGLVGLRPRSDNTIEINPLVPEYRWDWFCLDNVLYHGRIITVLWDKTGDKYDRGKGLQILVDGKQIAQSKTLTRLTGQLQ